MSKKDYINNNLLSNVNSSTDFYYNSKIFMYAPYMTDDEEIIKTTIFKCGFDKEILEKSNIILNGFDIHKIENMPTIWAIKNLCYSDLFLHIIVT